MGVKAGGQFVGEERDPMRFVRLGRLLNEPRILSHGAHQVPLALVRQKRNVGLQRARPD